MNLRGLLIKPSRTFEAQQPKKVSRIGYFVSSDSITESSRSEGIRRALRDLGYVEGQNIAFEYRYAEGKLDRFPELATELVRLKVDIIVAAGGARFRPYRTWLAVNWARLNNYQTIALVSILLMLNSSCAVTGPHSFRDVGEETGWINGGKF